MPTFDDINFPSRCFAFDGAETAPAQTNRDHESRIPRVFESQRPEDEHRATVATHAI